jgi:branched-chain amino acid aminotransferase
MSESQSHLLVYFENDIVPMGEAKIPILTHALHYGTGVFEGIRGYWNSDERELFLVRTEDHYRRWKANCRILNIDPRQSAHELAQITADLIRLNHFETDVYVRPLAYTSQTKVGVRPDGSCRFAIIAVPFGRYLPSENGLHAGVVSWRRIQDNAIPARGKICGAYVNSVLATMEAQANGFDEAILLNEDGHVAEGSTCNIFMVRDGILITPPPTDNILEGLVRASVIELAIRELDIPVVERSIDRTELYMADEVFFTGTAVELAPVTQVDHRLIGEGLVGPITRQLRALYTDASHGRNERYRPWLLPVYHPVMAALRS